MSVFCYTACADPESFARGGPTLTTVFFVFVFFDEGKEDPNSTKSRPSSARQRNAIKWRFASGPMMAFRWRADDGPSLVAL